MERAFLKLPTFDTTHGRSPFNTAPRKTVKISRSSPLWATRHTLCDVLQCGRTAISGTPQPEDQTFKSRHKCPPKYLLIKAWAEHPHTPMRDQKKISMPLQVPCQCHWSPGFQTGRTHFDINHKTFNQKSSLTPPVTISVRNT